MPTVLPASGHVPADLSFVTRLVVVVPPHYPVSAKEPGSPAPVEQLRDATGLSGDPMDAQREEYDRFGPWAIEISDEDPPPPLFVPYLTRAEPTLLSIKIPRGIERRDARPGMDLYDYLVCLYEDALLVLRRVGREVRSETCRYQDVQRLGVARDLLRGNIHLGLPGRPCDLPYNTVSDDLMFRLVALVRQHYSRQDREAPRGRELEVRAGELSFYFERLLATQRQQGTGMRLLAAQGTAPVCDPRMPAARRLLFRIASRRLLESMHLTDGRELMIVGRGPAYAYRWQAAYGTDTSYIPIANLRSVAWQEDAGNAAINLILRTGAGSSVHVFAHDNPSIESYAAFLSALPDVAQETKVS